MPENVSGRELQEDSSDDQAYQKEARANSLRYADKEATDTNSLQDSSVSEQEAAAKNNKIRREADRNFTNSSGKLDQRDKRLSRTNKSERRFVYSSRQDAFDLDNRHSPTTKSFRMEPSKSSVPIIRLNQDSISDTFSDFKSPVRQFKAELINLMKTV